MNGCASCSTPATADHVEFAKRRLHALLPHWPAPSHLSPAYRPVPQLRGGSAQGQTNKSITVKAADFSSAIQRVAQFADERSGAIRMKLEKNELKISSSFHRTGECEIPRTTDATCDHGSFAYASEARHRSLEFKDSPIAPANSDAEGKF